MRKCRPRQSSRWIRGPGTSAQDFAEVILDGQPVVFITRDVQTKTRTKAERIIIKPNWTVQSQDSKKAATATSLVQIVDDPAIQPIAMEVDADRKEDQPADAEMMIA